MARTTTLVDDARIALDSLGDAAARLFTPGVRLGVTGLSRSGKTVFISALVHNLLHGGRLPVFEPFASGRLASARLRPQPSMDVPRFQYEDHVRTLVEEREWPQSTRAISELRLTVDYESASFWSRTTGVGRLNIDLIDYPGEWLGDLPLLAMDYAAWSASAVAKAKSHALSRHSGAWLKQMAGLDPAGPEDETAARAIAEVYTRYLQDCRLDELALSTLTPGRFLMPGDLEGSPALTFAPLALSAGAVPARHSLHALMTERFEAYKSVVVKPFFRQHFARLDRQIVLVDVFQAVNAGPAALLDLEAAMSDILACFRAGRGNLFSALFGPRIDRILFAATKADHLHHENHDRLEALLARLVQPAIGRAEFSGAEIKVMAIAAVRATHEASLKDGGEELPVIVGTPIKGETIDGQEFDGLDTTAVFPGDLPADPEALLKPASRKGAAAALRFVRFRPPELERTSEGLRLSLPHIRLDRALQFLLADKLA